MLRVVTWCAKCLFLYCLVVVTALRFSWVFTMPVWQIANKMHWTQLKQVPFVLSYFLPIFAVAGFLIGLIPFGRLGKALDSLFGMIFPSAAVKVPRENGEVAPVLWAWVPVTFAFLIRFSTWHSRNSSILDVDRSPNRWARFFGPPSNALFDGKWISDRLIFTTPMIFLMACALAVLIRHRLGKKEEAV